MPKLLQIDFPLPGPFGEELAESRRKLAESIAQEPGLIWKIWTENPEAQEGGGIYLFSDEKSAKAYLEKHIERLTGLGIKNISAKIFDINETLTKITNGPS